MTVTLPPKRIPYGVADYGRLRRENAYYVDKTRFIPLIEAAPFYHGRLTGNDGRCDQRL